ncbi:hypothetical protein, partial [Neisseria sicca]|uniref:hypothetical protein n=1 Tax=Neisseria sicca TaxID=490 RepID=UPI001C99B44B
VAVEIGDIGRKEERGGVEGKGGEERGDKGMRGREEGVGEKRVERREEKGGKKEGREGLE